MSTEQKQKEKPEEIWRGIIEETKSAMQKAEGFKVQALKLCCERLEQAGMPVEMICGRLEKELTRLEFVTKSWFYAHVDKKYKDKRFIREPRKYERKNVPEQLVPQEGPDDHKKSTEQDSQVEDGGAEDTEIYEINVEDYRIEDVEKYDKKFLQQLVVYLHNKLQELQTRPTGKRK